MLKADDHGLAVVAFALYGTMNQEMALQICNQNQQAFHKWLPEYQPVMKQETTCVINFTKHQCQGRSSTLTKDCTES